MRRLFELLVVYPFVILAAVAFVVVGGVLRLLGGSVPDDPFEPFAGEPW